MKMVKNKVVITKAKRGGYGNEYKATFYKGKKKVYSEIIFGNDIKYANRMFTADFDKAPIIRKYKKKVSKVA